MEVKTKIARENYPASTIVSMFDKGEIRDDYPAQREDGQHSNAYRDGFIASVIKNEDFDSIKACEEHSENGTTLWIIDGKQRCSEIRGYKKGLFKLGHNIERPIITYQIARKDDDGNFIKDEHNDIIFDEYKCDIRGKKYQDLPSELQDQFDNCQVYLIKHLDCTKEDIGYHMRRYNRQASFNGAQTCITYCNERAGSVKNISFNNRFFLDSGKFTANELKKGKLDRVVVESYMTVFHLDSWNKQVNKIGQFVDENATDEEFETLDEYFTRLNAIADGKYPDFFNTKNTFVFVPVFAKFTELGLPDENFANFLDALEGDLRFRDVNGTTYDEMEENRATKDRTTVIAKVNLLTELMKEFFHVKCADDEMEEFFISDATGIGLDEVLDSMDLYKQSLKDFQDKFIPQDSPLRDPKNHLSLLALIAYAYQEDIDPDGWFEIFGAKNKSCIKDQKQNYYHMRDDLNNFVGLSAVAS